MVDSKQISDIYLLTVTLGSYPHLITRLANINPVLGLFSDSQYPWAISLCDLAVVTDLIESPATFIHYTKRRLSVERTTFDVMADEVDLLGFYFTQGLYFDLDEFKKSNGVALSGFSVDIDRYCFEKHELGMDTEKPTQKMPPGFAEYVSALEELESPYATDCAVRLLDLNYESRRLLVVTAEKIKQQTREDGQLHSFSTVVGSSGLGLSLISMHASGDVEELYRQVFCFSVLKKHVTKCREWVGLGWDANGGQAVNVCVFLSFDWQEDAVLAKMARDNLRPGQKLSDEN